MPARPPVYRPNATRPRDDRPSACHRGYGRPWQKIRKAYLAIHPLCEECQAAGLTVGATEVDHIVSLARGGTHDAENLRPLCKPCHSRKTNRCDGGFGRQPRVLF